MEKYLFTDGTNGVIEVQSQEELSRLVESAERPDKIRIWVFNSNEWLSYTGYNKVKPILPIKEKGTIAIDDDQLSKPPSNYKAWLKRSFFIILGGIAIFLVYNFTRINWVKAGTVNIIATRPTNVPVTDIDSLLNFLEASKGQKLDKVTRTNLRIRNDWPSRIGLQLTTDRDTSHTTSRYYNMSLTIDNTTGYVIDNAVVKLTVWRNNSVSSADTFQFNNISYALAAKRKVDDVFRGDSIAVSFESVRAKVFNFCYSADKKSNYGNNNDRWFCR